MQSEKNGFASRLKRISSGRNQGEGNAVAPVAVQNAKRIKIVPFLAIENMHSLLGCFDHALSEGHLQFPSLFPLTNYLGTFHLLSLSFTTVSVTFSTAGYIVKIGKPFPRQKKTIFWIDDGKGHEIEVDLITRECTEQQEQAFSSAIKAGNFIILHNVKLYMNLDQNVAIIANPTAKNAVLHHVGNCVEYGTCNHAGGCTNSYFRKQGFLCDKHLQQKALSLRSARSQFAYGYGAC